MQNFMTPFWEKYKAYNFQRNKETIKYRNIAEILENWEEE